MNGMEMVEDILRRAIQELNMQLEDDKQMEYSDELQLIGKECLIDSMDRTMLVVFIETELEEKAGKEISLFDDKRFSNNDETNPFYSIRNLKQYIVDILGE